MALIRRHLQTVLREHMFRGKAILLLGARQVGKSTLMRQILEDETLGVPPGKILSLDCDDVETRNALRDATLEDVRRLVADNQIVFVDEAQRVPGVGLTLKMIVDHFPKTQLLVTGSSSFLLQGKLNEPLTGRKFEYRLYPVSTQELRENGGDLLARRTLESRLVYGSYPDVLTGADDAREILMNLSGSYMYQDLLALEGIRKPAVLEKLLTALALQIGGEVSWNELAQTAGTDPRTAEKYVDLLEKCHVVFRLNALSRNLRSELKKSRKIYFHDNGIRNAVIRNLNPLSMRQDVGALWENFLVGERLKRNHYNGRYANAYFWRTTSQSEIDYVEEADGKFDAFEMKWNPKKAGTKLPSAFASAYPVGETGVVTPENYLDWVG